MAAETCRRRRATGALCANRLRPRRAAGGLAVILFVVAAVSACPPEARAQQAASNTAALVTEGVRLARDGHFAQAISTFEKALADNPDDRNARHNLALACYNSGRYRRAEREFAKVLEAQPRALDARKGLGATQLALHKYAAAAESLQAVIDVVPNDAVALGALGRAHMGAGNPREALDPLRKAGRLRPQEPGLAFELGKAAQAVGDHTEAKRAFARVLALKPESAAAALGLAKAQIATDESLMAVGVLKPFADQPRADKDILAALAEAYENLGLEEDALRARARLAAVLPPEEAVPLRLQLGDAYLKKLRRQEALEQFIAASAADPTCADAHIGLARCHHGLGQTKDEIAHWRAATHLAPARIDVWLELASALTRALDYPAALQALDSALQSDPVNVKALEAAANAARALDDLLLAEAYLRRILALDPRDFAARMAVVDVLVERGQLAKGLIEAGEALRAPDPPPEAHMKVAYLAEELGNYELAITRWRDLMAQGGEHAPAAGLELGRLLVTVHRAPEAIDVYRQLTNLRPASEKPILGRARALQSIGKDEDAAALLIPLLERTPGLAEARVTLAESLSWLGRHAQARREMQKALAGGGLSEQGCRTLVLVCERGGRPEEAIATLERLIPDGAPLDVCIELLVPLYRRLGRRKPGGDRLLKLFDRHPKQPSIGLAAAQLLAESGDLTTADQVLRGIAQRDASRDAALRQLVATHVSAGRADRALEPLRRLLEPDPAAAGVVAMLAEIAPRPDMAANAADIILALAQADRGSPAYWARAADLARFLDHVPTELARLQGLATVYPGHPGIATGLAALALHDGRPGLAESAIAGVPNDRRDDRALLSILARAQSALGKTDSAMSSLRKAIDGGHAASEDHVFYADLLRNSGRIEEALWHLVVALRLDPTRPDAREAMAAIIHADDLPTETLMEALRQVYFHHPDAPVVFDLMTALSRRADAQQLCEEWLRRHPGTAARGATPD